jgi:PA domain
MHNRGNTTFDVKAQSCQNSGGIGIIIYNTERGLIKGTLESGTSVTIPVVSISIEDGEKLVANNLGQIVTVRQGIGYTYLDGTSMAVSSCHHLILFCKHRLTSCRNCSRHHTLPVLSGLSGELAHYAPRQQLRIASSDQLLIWRQPVRTISRVMDWCKRNRLTSVLWHQGAAQYDASIFQRKTHTLTSDGQRGHFSLQKRRSKSLVASRLVRPRSLVPCLLRDTRHAVHPRPARFGARS